MEEKVRVRFAPSPTGALHVGGARTALYNWLFARHHGGKFILRIEDTDRERSTEESLRAILEGLRWLGLDWDEGPEAGGPFGPYFQSERSHHHRRVVDALLESKNAYPCFCPPERLSELRRCQRAGKKPILYDRHCLGLPKAEVERRLRAGVPHTVRFRIPDGATVYDDLIKGPVEIRHEELDDLIILRSDGTPTYNLVVVADDLAMEVTHVIRGEDHITNTPKQILMIRALGREVPRYAHLPLILGQDKKPLSKRHGATNLTHFRDVGYPREAMMNFLALLGWSYSDREEVFAPHELVERFSLERVSRSGAVFDYEKLDWLSGFYLRTMSLGDFTDFILPFWVRAGWIAEAEVPAHGTAGAEVPARRTYLEDVARLHQERIRFGAQIVEKTDYYFLEDFSFDPKAIKKLKKREDGAEILTAYARALEDDAFEDPQAMEDRARAWTEERDMGFGALVHPVRAALTGKTATPGLFDVMIVLGKERVLRRLREAALKLERGAI